MLCARLAFPGRADRIFGQKPNFGDRNGYSHKKPKWCAITALVANSLVSALLTAYASDIVVSGNIWEAELTSGEASMLFARSTTSNVVSQNSVVSK